MSVARVDRLGVLDRIQERGIFGRELRVQDALERVDEVVRGHRHAVRPGVVADLERVGQAVVADRPALGRARDRLGVGGVREQAHERVADDIVFPGAGHEVRVEALGLAHGGDPVDHLGLRRTG